MGRPVSGAAADLRARIMAMLPATGAMLRLATGAMRYEVRVALQGLSKAGAIWRGEDGMWRPCEQPRQDDAPRFSDKRTLMIAGDGPRYDQCAGYSDCLRGWAIARGDDEARCPARCSEYVDERRGVTA